MWKARMRAAMCGACLAGAMWLAGLPTVASAGEGLNGTASSESVEPLAFAAGGGTLVPELAQEAEALRHVAPEAVQARQASKTAYHGLSPSAAIGVLNESFPTLVHAPTDGLPQLPQGESAGKLLDTHAAQLSLSGGGQAVVESTSPIAVREASGNLASLDTGLVEERGAFAPKRSAVAVSLPKSLAEGVSLPQLGITLTPLAASGSAAASASTGTLDGDAVFWGGVSMGKDVDAMARATSTGVDLSAILRSAESPETLRYKVGLPQDTTLSQAVEGEGPIAIVQAGRPIATIPMPTASDAEGTPVSVSMTVSHDVLELKVDAQPGEVRYPLEVDPEVKAVAQEGVYYNWIFSEVSGGTYTHAPSWIQNEGGWSEPGFPENEWAYYGYATKGDSKIYEASVSEAYLWGNWEGLERELGSGFAKQYVELGKPGIEQHIETLAEPEPTHKWIHSATLCAQALCSPEGGAEGNAVNLVVTTTKSSAYLMEHWGSELQFNWPKGFSYTSEIKQAAIDISEPAGTHAAVKYSTAHEIDKTINVEDTHGGLGPDQGAFEVEATDFGLGVAGMLIELKSQSGNWETLISKDYLTEGSGCAGVQCSQTEQATFTYGSFGARLPEGKDTIRASAYDPTTGSSSTEYGEGERTLYVDTKAPKGIEVSGLKSEVNEEGQQELMLGEAPVQIEADATDGEGSVESSGIASLAIEVDEHRIGAAQGECFPGPCTASGEWTLNGSELGVGMHTLTVVATDNAGNIGEREYPLKVYPASPVALGPGSVNPESGDFALEADDVEMSGGLGGLSVTRHYDSLNTSEGAEGPLGPQWTLNLAGLASLGELPDGSIMVVGPEGLAHFAKTASGFEAPPGDQNLTLEFKEQGSQGQPEYLLRDPAKGTTTRFTKPIGAEAWMPTVSEGPVATNTTTDTYTTVEPEEGKTIVEPTLELAAHPDAECARGKMERGCRALEFAYGEATTATQEEWGEYKGRLMGIKFIAWDPATGKMREVEVARYAYDSQGRLRAEWNPSIEPALKTTYGYDEESHVTAVSPPGQEPWLIQYGTAAGDPSLGRVVAVSRPHASASLGSIAAPANEAVPALSSQEPGPGATIKATTGSWSGNPLDFGYQWYDCAGKCVPIEGAINNTYVPKASDVGYRLMARVSATNSAGTTMIASRESEPLPARARPQFDVDGKVASTSYGITYESHVLPLELHLFSHGAAIEYLKCARVYGGGTIGTGGEGAINLQLSECSIGSKEGCSIPIIMETGSLPVALAYGDQEEGAATPRSVLAVNPVGLRGRLMTLRLMNCAHAGSFEVVGSLVLKLEEAGVEARAHRAMTLEGPPSFELDGHYYTGEVAIVGLNSRGWWQSPSPFPTWLLSVGESNTWSTAPGAYLSYPNGEAPELPESSGLAVATVEYGVSVSGKDAPYELGASEVARWAQKDDPAYATAIFPPEEPQAWPAGGEYKRATIYYMDSEGRTVNVAGPGEAIGTTEYDASNNVVRSLSPENRARALEAGAESAAVSERLDTRSVYGDEESELAETLGPEHEVELSDGEKLQARNRVRYFYDEGAPEGEGGEVEEYGLVTKTVDGALLAGGEEQDVRTTLTGYSGQEGLGWRLRAPTSTTVDPRGLDLVTGTRYNEETGAVEESRSPGGDAEVVSPLEPVLSFGSEGDGGGQFNYPQAVAVAANGDVWVADKGKSRLEVFSGSGGFIAAYGAAGSGEGQFNEPCGIAIDRANGDVFVADTQNDRVQELGPGGEFIRAWGTEGSGAGEFDVPAGIAIDGSGHVWVSDYGDDRVQEFSETGSFIRQFGSQGTGDGQFEHARALAFSQGMLYVVDEGNRRVQQFTAKGVYAGQFGVGQLESPWGIAVAPVTGDLYVSDEAGNDLVEFSPAGKLLTSFGYWGSGLGKLEAPTGLAVSATGELLVAEQNNDRVSVWRPAEAGAAHLSYSTQFGAEGSGEGQFEWPLGVAVDRSGEVWVSDNHSGRVEKFSAQGRYLAEFGSEGSEEKQLDGPSGVAVNQATGDLYIGDCGNHRVQERNESGEVLRNFSSDRLACPDGVAVDSMGDVWVSDSGNDEVEQFSASGAFLHAYGSQGAGQLQFQGPAAIAFANERLYVLDTHNNRVQELSLSGEYLGQFGTEGSGGGQFEDPEGIAADAAGDIFVSDTRNNRIEEFTASGKYLQSIASHGQADGQLSTPQGLAITPAGSIYTADANNHRIQKWIRTTQTVHDTKTIYYGAEANGSYPQCGEHPEWVGLPCETQPGAQPEGEDTPLLPVTRIEYNIYDQREKTIETFGSVTRTKSTTFEESGRPVGASVTAGIDKPVATVSDKYDPETGALIEQSTDGEEGEEAISRSFNTLGQLTTYTDADGNTTSYSYDAYGRLSEVNYDVTGLDGMTATQQYTYDETTGELSELEDSDAGAFKASYNVEGALTSETYPNGMVACYGYNSVGEAISLRYVKGSGCGGEGGSVWFSQSVAPSVHGEWLSQKSSLANTSYAYDSVGRLTEVQEEPAGEGCTVRLYSYDLEGDRTSQTTRKPSPEGECAEGGGETLRHTYDEADRLDDEGVAYEALGNITSLPEADANGGKLTSEYYADGQVWNQDQDGTLNTYMLDPEGRVRETVTVNEKTGSQTVISHYAETGSTPSWTYNQTTEAWTRNVTGIGGVVALQEAGKEAVLQMSDLDGDIVGTASLSEEASEPLSMERSTEFGVPVSKEPTDKLGWLGASGVSPQLPSGAIVQDGATYVPLIGMALQTEGTASPMPINTAIPYVAGLAPGENGMVEASAAYESAIYNEAVRKIEEAADPVGDLPESWCDEWTENCGYDPQHGDNTHECKVWASWGSPSFGYYIEPFLTVWGHFECKDSVYAFELQLQIQQVVSGGVEGGQYIKEKTFDFVFGVNERVSAGHESKNIECTTGDQYRAWVWGRYWYASGKTAWSALAIDGRLETCPEVNVY